MLDIKWKLKPQSNRAAIVEALELIESCLENVKGYSIISKLETELKKVSGIGHKFDFIIHKNQYSYGDPWKITISTWNGSCRNYEYILDLKAKTIPAVREALGVVKERAKQWEDFSDHKSYYQNRIGKVIEETLCKDGTLEQFESTKTQLLEALLDVALELKSAQPS